MLKKILIVLGILLLVVVFLAMRSYDSPELGQMLMNEFFCAPDDALLLQPMVRVAHDLVGHRSYQEPAAVRDQYRIDPAVCLQIRRLCQCRLYFSSKGFDTACIDTK